MWGKLTRNPSVLTQVSQAPLLSSPRSSLSLDGAEVKQSTFGHKLLHQKTPFKTSIYKLILKYKGMRERDLSDMPRSRNWRGGKSHLE